MRAHSLKALERIQATNQTKRNLRGHHMNIDDIEEVYTREEIIDSEIGIGAETEVNEEKKDDKMDVQVSAVGLGGQDHGILD